MEPSRTPVIADYQPPPSRARRVKDALIASLALLPPPARRGVTRTYQRFAPAFYRAISRARRSGSYRRWIRLYDTLDAGAAAAIAADIGRMARPPLISVVMPVHNPPDSHLRAALDSVFAQLYGNWELCIADDASSEPHVAGTLARCAARDPRVRLVSRTVNGGISAATNDAIALATGEFVAFLDHDDALSPHALYVVAREILAHPQADLLYSDEDKIDARGRRREPHFKSDWNLDLLRSQNMISHLGVYRTALVRRLGGLDGAFDGSQDYDLALRVGEAASPDRIRHIPQILYHWRAIPGSTALSPSGKPQAADAARRAVAAHLHRSGIAADAISTGEHSYQHVFYSLEAEPLVSIVIPTRDRQDLLSRCVGSILARTDYRNLEILIVDNGSTERETRDYLAAIARDARVRVLDYPHAFNFSLINNWAVERSNGSVLLFLNNDTEVIGAGWLRHLAANACRPEVGAVGAKLLYPTNRVQHGGVVLGMGGVAGHFHLGCRGGDPGYFGRAVLQQNLSAVTAACVAMRCAVFDEIGGFDGANLRVAFNDVDLCLRIRECGYLIVWTPLALLYHHESASRGSDLLPERHAEFQREVGYMHKRWAATLGRDPYFNPNLSLRDQSIAFAFPPRVQRPWRAAP
jgi:glycosyltransferase involved in cell wall biosynthesis